MHPSPFSDTPRPPVRGDAVPTTRTLALHCDCRALPAPSGSGGVSAWLAQAWLDPARCAPAPVETGLQVCSLEIRGVAACEVWRIRVECAGTAVFDLDAVRDRRGGWTSAGELLRDMARQFGFAGLTIDLGGAPAAARTLAVQLLLRTAADPSHSLQLTAQVQAVPGGTVSR